MRRPALCCGELIEHGSYCPEHRPVKLAPEKRGYDYAWSKLSKRARKLQPFCTDCGATENLSLDHSPAAWAKIAAGKQLTLKDCADGLAVVRCQYHNNLAGPARGRRVTREA